MLNAIGIVNPNVRELATIFVAKYKDALKQRPEPWAAEVSGMSDADGRTKFPIDLTAMAGFREWIGARKAVDGDLTAFYIDSLPWERSIDVPLDVALHMRGFAPYVNKVPHLIAAAVSHRNILIANLIKNAKTALCWDGTAFFGTTHPVDFRAVNSKAQFANLYTSKPFTTANFAFAKKAFRQMKAPDNKTTLGLRLTAVMGGTDMEETFDAVFLKSIIANAAGTASDTNIYLKAAKPIIAPELDALNEPNVWYGIAANTGSMPFETAMADNGEPQITILGDGTEFAVDQNAIRFAGKLYGNAGYAIPHTIIRFEP